MLGFGNENYFLTKKKMGGPPVYQHALFELSFDPS
jgi:hypothetical protein